MNRFKYSYIQLICSLLLVIALAAGCGAPSGTLPSGEGASSESSKAVSEPASESNAFNEKKTSGSGRF